MPKKAPKGMEWVLVSKSELTEEQKVNLAMDQVSDGIRHIRSLGGGWTFEQGLQAVDEFSDYFPGSNQVPENGAWIMVRKSPPTEYTVPPMSFWFAEPWPMAGLVKNTVHRVKVVTPKGNLGILPHEYSLVKDISKYYEFLGGGIDIVFFGNEDTGLPPDKLLYLRSRGIKKQDAITMLIGEIKKHGVCYLKTRKEITDMFDLEWPRESSLAL
jgi:hypothetical protein